MYFTKDDGRLVRIGGDQIEQDYGVGEVETVISLINKRYLDTVDRKELVDAAIHTTFDNLDVYSNYISPEDSSLDDESLSTNFKGIGIEMVKKSDSINITHSNYGSPARMAGINEGDVILEVNGTSMVGPDITYGFLRSKITESDSCNVVFLDYQTQDVDTVLLANRLIENDDATIHGMLSEDVGIIKIRQFNSRTYEQFMSSLESLDTISDNLNLIIDVRNNPGGFLPQVTRILDQLIFDKDRLILSTIDRNGNKREYFSKAKNFFKIDKLAVLVNQNSASASEILAGVIQDLDIGVIVGDTTYGKGLVQEQFRLASGGKLRLTVSSYHLPSGRSIQKWKDVGIHYADCDSLDQDYFKSIKYSRSLAQCNGIVPDIFVPDNECSYDYIAMTYASMTYDSLSKERINEVRNMTFDTASVLKVLEANHIVATNTCIPYFMNEIEYLMDRRQMPDHDATFAKLKREDIVIRTMNILKSPIRELLLDKD